MSYFFWQHFVSSPYMRPGMGMGEGLKGYIPHLKFSLILNKNTNSELFNLWTPLHKIFINPYLPTQNFWPGFCMVLTKFLIRAKKVRGRFQSESCSSSYPSNCICNYVFAKIFALRFVRQHQVGSKSFQNYEYLFLSWNAISLKENSYENLIFLSF